MFKSRGLFSRIFIIFTIVSLVGFAFYLTKESVKSVTVVNLLQVVEEEEEKPTQDVKPEVDLIFVAVVNSYYQLNSTDFTFPLYLTFEAQQEPLDFLRPPSA